MSRTTHDWACYNCGKKDNKPEHGVVRCSDCGTILSGIVPYTTIEGGVPIVHYPNGKTEALISSHLKLGLRENE